LFSRRNIEIGLRRFIAAPPVPGEKLAGLPVPTRWLATVGGRAAAQRGMALSAVSAA